MQKIMKKIIVPMVLLVAVMATAKIGAMNQSGGDKKEGADLLAKGGALIMKGGKILYDELDKKKTLEHTLSYTLSLAGNLVYTNRHVLTMWWENYSFHTGAKEGFLDTVKYHIAIKGSKVDEKDVNGQTALHIAAKAGHLEIVAYLIQSGAKINEKDKSGQTALHIAAKEGKLGIVQYLVDKGADLAAVDNAGKIAQDIAAAQGKTAVVEYLVMQIKVDGKDASGRTALHWAAANGSLRVAKFYVEKGAKLDEVDNAYYSALHHASEKGHLEIVEYLVQKGATVNAKTNDGDTASQLAAKSGFPEIVKYLIDGIESKTEGVFEYKNLAPKNLMDRVCDKVEAECNKVAMFLDDHKVLSGIGTVAIIGLYCKLAQKPAEKDK